MNPITGTSWEGIGVQPDLTISAAAAQPAALWEILDTSAHLPDYARRDITSAIKQLSSQLEQQAPGTTGMIRQILKSH